MRHQKGGRLRVIPVDDSGQILLDGYQKLLGHRTKLVAFTQVSNALGTITPAKQMITAAHAMGAKGLLDGAQAVSHMRVDVQDLNPDFYVFSGHKVFGPTGIGALYGKQDLLNQMRPWQGGGNMIRDVTFERTTYHATPGRFEAGTGNIPPNPSSDRHGRLRLRTGRAILGLRRPTRGQSRQLPAKLRSPH